MNFREFCQNSSEKRIFKLAVSFLVLSFIFSISLYLREMRDSLNNDILLINTVKSKIYRTYEIKRLIERVALPEQITNEIAMAKFLDEINARFPEVKFELLTEKQDGEEIVLPFSISGKSDFHKILDMLSFLKKKNYPVCFVDSVSLKAKENLIDFEIKGEIRVIK